MKTYAMYVGYKETKVPKNRVFIVGYYECPNSYVIRCKGTEFVYSSRKVLDINWVFFRPTNTPFSLD